MVDDPGTAYAKSVVTGETIAGELVRLACERHLADLKKSRRKSFPYEYDAGKARRAVAFCQFLQHYKGSAKGTVFEPMPWQCFILGSVFGWIEKETGLRRFRYAYVEVPRKNGKTFLAAGVALYMLIADGEAGSEVYSAATKKDQAALVWNDSWKMVQKSKWLRRHLHQRYKCIEHDDSDSKYEPLGSDSKTLDGLNPHCAIKDELHEWPSSALWDVIVEAYGARDQPLDFSITTAGYNVNGICYEIREHCIQVLDADGYEDDRQFAYIATVDRGAEKDWYKEENWWKANPCLGVAKKLDYMRDAVDAGRKNPRRENAVKNKQFNIWTSGAEKWMDPEVWKACAGLDVDSLAGARCIAGIDLATTTDLAATAFVFPPDSERAFWGVTVKFYLPEDSPHSGRSKQLEEMVTKWAEAGFITLTPGDVIDYDYIENDILEARDVYDIQAIGTDPYNATATNAHLIEEGFDVTNVRQGFRSMSGPMKELEKLARQGKIRHDGNPVLAWMMRNVVARTDVNANIAPDKEKSAEKIDGVVALIIGLAVAIATPDKRSVYEDRGPLVIG